MKTYYFAVNPAAYGSDIPICVDWQEASRLMRDWYWGEDDAPAFDEVWTEASGQEIQTYGVYDSTDWRAQFPAFWAEALTASDRDAYVSDWALSSIWGDDPESEIPAERIEYLGQIWDAAHMSVRDICKAAGLSQTALAQRFGIPQRTVSDWCRSLRTPTDYTRLMMCELLGIVRR